MAFSAGGPDWFVDVDAIDRGNVSQSGIWGVGEGNDSAFSLLIEGDGLGSLGPGDGARVSSVVNFDGWLGTWILIEGEDGLVCGSGDIVSNVLASDSADKVDVAFF